MKKVVLDCDGVMVDFVKGYLALLNKHGGTDFEHADISDWDIVECLKVPKAVEMKANEEVDYDFCRRLRPIAGSIAGVKAVLAAADVLFLTSPWLGARGWTDARYEWLWERFGKVKVMHGSAKEWVDADVFVDDKTSTVIAWAKAHPGRQAVLWAQPWNRNAPPGDYIRTDDWNVILQLTEK